MAGRAAQTASSPVTEVGVAGAADAWTRRLPELATVTLRAQRPILLLGQGAAGAAADVVRLAERLGAPVVTTPSGRGTVPEDHPLSLAFEYLRGGLAALNETLERADLILALGCKLGHNGSGGFRLRLPEEHLVHVDTDPEALGANYPARMLLNARVEDLVPALLEALGSAAPTAAWTAADIASWRDRVAGPSADPEPRVHGVEPGTAAAFFGGLRAALPRDAVLVTDSGLHQYLARRHFPVLAPRGLVMPTDFQSMGFGLPAALGAGLAAPERPVVAVIGDGGLIMSAMELLTAVREEIPVVVVVFNDGHLNLIRLQQMRDWGRLSSVELLNPDMEGLADALGVRYRRFEGDFHAAVTEPLTGPGPTLVEVQVGDSPGIRRMARRGAARGVVRRALPRSFLDRLKQLLGRG